jgi:hypothetical protein
MLNYRCSEASLSYDEVDIESTRMVPMKLEASCNLGLNWETSITDQSVLYRRAFDASM